MFAVKADENVNSSGPSLEKPREVFQMRLFACSGKRWFYGFWRVFSAPTAFLLFFLLFSVAAPPAWAIDYDKDPYQKEHGLIRDDEFFLVRQGTQGNGSNMWSFTPAHFADEPNRRAPNQWERLADDFVEKSYFYPWGSATETVLFGYLKYGKDYLPYLVDVGRYSQAAPVGADPGDISEYVNFSGVCVGSSAKVRPTVRTLHTTKFTGAFGAVTTDLDGDGISEIVTAGRRENRSPLVFSGISLVNETDDYNVVHISQTSPADSANSGVYSGVRLAAGDLDGDGTPELVAAFQCADDTKETQHWATAQIGIHIAGDTEVEKKGDMFSYHLKRLHEGKTATTVNAVFPLSYFPTFCRTPGATSST